MLVVRRSGLVLLLSLVATCAHDPRPPSSSQAWMENRVAFYRARFASLPICARDAPAVSVARAKTGAWAAGERLAVRGRLTIEENGACKKKRCEGGGCCNRCRYGEDPNWRLSDAPGTEMDLRGWSMVEGGMDCEQEAERLAIGDVPVIVTIVMVEPGPIHALGHRPITYQGRPRVDAVCRVDRATAQREPRSKPARDRVSTAAPCPCSSRSTCPSTG